MKKSVLFLIMLLLLTGCGKSTDTVIDWKEQYDLGMRYLEEEDYEQAIVAFTVAIEIDPNQPEVYVARGRAYVLKGETEENLSLAQADYEMAINLDETFAEAYLGLADVYIRQKNYGEAVEGLYEGMKKTENDEEILKKIDQMEKGRIVDSQNRDRLYLRYDESGNLMCKEEYTYNEEGLISVASYNGLNEQLSFVDILYNEQGYPIQSYTERIQGYETVFSKVSNEYDSNGNLIKNIQYREDGTVFEYTTYEYDDEGNNIKSNTFRYQGESEIHLDEYSIYEYDINGNIIKDSYYDADDVLNGYVIYKYDNNENLLETHQYNASGDAVSYDEYEYDINGNRIKRTKWHCDLGFSYYEYEYDVNGELVRTKYKDEEGIEYVEDPKPDLFMQL